VSRHYLFGPATPEYVARNLQQDRVRGECLAFDPSGAIDLQVRPDDSWQTICERLPAGWQPDFIVLFLPYTTIPDCLWTAPVPLIGLAADWNLLWHSYSRLRDCDLIFTDTAGVETLTRAGITQARVANLFGCNPFFLEAPPTETPRDIDILFVGNLRRAVQRQRLRWLGRIAGLAQRWNVIIRTEVYGEDYRDLLRRARIVFNHSLRGECNMRVFEAAASGALLFQESDNREVASYFRDRRECVFYDENNLETLLTHYLDHEDERLSLAARARERMSEYRAGLFWAEARALVDREWPELQERARHRPAIARTDSWLVARTWQELSSDMGDPALVADLTAALVKEPATAALHNALGLAEFLEARRAKTTPPMPTIIGRFQRALQVAPDQVVMGLNLVEAQVAAGQADAAIEKARQLLKALSLSVALSSEWLQTPHFPPDFDDFRVEWERAGWLHAGNVSGEAQAKRELLRWRLHSLLADLTDELTHYFEAAMARPDLPVTRAALGCALARAGRHVEAAAHLQFATETDPLDAAAARALFDVYGIIGDVGAQRRLARQRRLLARAAPQVVAEESWFAEAAPDENGLASLIILCCNEVDYTRLCLESVLRHTHAPYELILIDNGSSDGTPAYLDDVRKRAGPVRVVVIRNESNRGFARGCNQGLAASRGRYLILLNNDTIVTAGWLHGLIACASHDGPRIGLVGAVSNYSAPPQQITVTYRNLEDLEAFAARRRQEHAGQALEAERLLGFCLLIRREVFEKLGALDERFGLGFFEDDDLSVRAREAGFRLAVALDVFVHHFGSRTFASLGIDCYRQLEDNFAVFRDKWGSERCRGYRLPERMPPRRSAGPESVTAPGEATEKVGARPRVSLCMIVKNEEAHLAACLRSVADLVDEMIVVDTGSSDRTKDIAARAGAQVLDHVWQDSFAAARNESLRHATGQWILWLDADEYLDETNRQRLRNLLDHLPDSVVGYLMRQRSPLEGGPHAVAQVDHLRLFPNHPRIRWHYRVHEQILPAIRAQGGDLQTTEVVIEHCGFAEPALQGAKVERNLRLLQLEFQERPDDAFVLYNLGAVALTQGRVEEALSYLQRSLANSHPSDTVVPKLHALIVRSHHQMGRRSDALTGSRAARQAFPRDAELLFWEAVLLREEGSPGEAALRLEEILQTSPTAHLTSVDAGLYGYRTRHVLAEVYRDLKRDNDAESMWQAVLTECPSFNLGRLNLAELFFEQSRWNELEAVTETLLSDPQSSHGAFLLRGRALLARKEYAGAQCVAETLIGQAPQELKPRILLSHVHLRHGADWSAAEQALLEVLTIDPLNNEALHNLRVLLDQQGRNGVPKPLSPADGSFDRPSNGAAAPRISLCMIVKNEETNLADCLSTVVDLVDESIVVDTGSTDRTKEIAAGFGARVLDFPWIDSFAAARNESLRHATGQWIFWMDADDRLDEENRAKLRSLVANLSDENAAFVMHCLCLPESPSSVATRVHHVRLFRNQPRLRWTYRIHEQILPALRELKTDIRWSDVEIQHTGYRDPSLRGRKLKRDLRLLQLNLAEKPEDPFVLFNLGQVYQDLNRPETALGLFQRSLERSHAADSIVRKLFTLMAQCQVQLGRLQDALTACQAGRSHYPDDLELLYQEGAVRRDLGDVAGAISMFEQALRTPVGSYFASVPTGLNSYLSRHQLAQLYRAQGRHPEAEDQWRAALTENPELAPAWLGLGDLYLSQERWQEVEEIAQRVEARPEGRARAARLRGNSLLVRKDFVRGRSLLEEACQACPRDLELRRLLSHLLLQEGRDWDAAEAALRDVLELDPADAQTQRNLSVLLQKNH
jgi:glycosyltransferase involved in cell wall biosynthesis/predicted Zn-dependent protease